MKGLIKIGENLIKYIVKSGSRFADNFASLKGVSKLFSKNARNVGKKVYDLSDEAMIAAFKRNGRFMDSIPQNLTTALAKPNNSENAAEFFDLLSKSTPQKGSFFSKIKKMADKLKATKGGKVAFGATRLMVEMAVWEAAEEILFDSDSMDAQLAARELVNSGMITKTQMSHLMAPGLANSMEGTDKVATLSDIRYADELADFVNANGSDGLKSLLVQSMRVAQSCMARLSSSKSVQLSVMLQLCYDDRLNANFDDIDFSRIHSSEALDELFATVQSAIVEYKENEFDERKDQPSAALRLAMLSGSYIPEEVLDAGDDVSEIMDILTERDYDIIFNTGSLSFTQLLAQASLVNGGYVNKQKIKTLL